MGDDKRTYLTHYEDVEPYVTKDGSLIRELMHPNVHGNSNLSVAEATILPGKATVLHKYTRLRL